MAQSATYKVHKRRKREGKTNYKKRLSLLLSNKPRLIVRKTNKRIIIQISEYHSQGDKTLLTANSKELKEFGYNGHMGNSKAGYLTGFLGGKRALNSKIDEAILDIGMVSPVKGSVVFAVLLGAHDAGLKIPHNKKVLPSPETFSDLEKVKKKITGA